MITAEDLERFAWEDRPQHLLDEAYDALGGALRKNGKFAGMMNRMAEHAIHKINDARVQTDQAFEEEIARLLLGTLSIGVVFGLWLENQRAEEGWPAASTHRGKHAKP
jgi:hypothetical protein